MATPTYIPLAELTLAAPTDLVVFGSISQDYSDLVMVVEQTGASGNTSIRMTLNGADTNYSNVYLAGNGSSNQSGKNSGYTRIQVGGFLEYASVGNLQSAYSHIIDYSATDKYKTVLSRSYVGAGAGAGLSLWCGSWENTSAVTSVSILSADYAVGSTFKLFGIHGEVA
tara:strand:- start:1187 stop:1693 length:507 start_codon:yes stop_codon:yes gene_type:complete